VRPASTRTTEGAQRQGDCSARTAEGTSAEAGCRGIGRGSERRGNSTAEWEQGRRASMSGVGRAVQTPRFRWAEVGAIQVSGRRRESGERTLARQVPHAPPLRANWKSARICCATSRTLDRRRTGAAGTGQPAWLVGRAGSDRLAGATPIRWCPGVCWLRPGLLGLRLLLRW
jgi:hypothetical protein